jgi:hypothetical protein
LHLRLRSPSYSRCPQRRALPSPPCIYLYSASCLLYAPAHAVATARPPHETNTRAHHASAAAHFCTSPPRAARTASASSPPTPLHPHPRLSRCLRIGYFARPSLPLYHLYVRSSYTSSSVHLTIHASLPPFLLPAQFFLLLFFYHKNRSLAALPYRDSWRTSFWLANHAIVGPQKTWDVRAPETCTVFSACP